VKEWGGVFGKGIPVPNTLRKGGGRKQSTVSREKKEASTIGQRKNGALLFKKRKGYEIAQEGKVSLISVINRENGYFLLEGEENGSLNLVRKKGALPLKTQTLGGIRNFPREKGRGEGVF